jgi:hypothetical protein
MREDDGQFGRFVPLLRRAIVLVAVLIAAPVILWTITAFVRAYVGPPKVPTFHQVAATASVNAQASSDAAAGVGDQPQAGVSDSSSATVATATDARGMAASGKGPLLDEHPSSGDSNAPSSATKMADMSSAAQADQRGAAVPAVAAAAAPDVAAANAGAAMPGASTAVTANATQQSGTVTQLSADTMPAAAPLTDRIPLPRRRPRVFAMVDSAMPMPRPRPDSAAPATPDTTTTGPLDFLQNLFGSK